MKTLPPHFSVSLGPRLPYYKAYPRDFLEGTIGMCLELKGAYRVLLDLIYVCGGRLPDDARYISGQLGCSVKKWGAVRRDLLAMGKLQVTDGFLTNLRVDKELEILRSFQSKQQENGSKGGKSKALRQALAKPEASQSEPEPEPESKERDSEAHASDGDAVQPVKELFDEGIKLLLACNIRERQARATIGKWRKDFPNQDEQIRDAIRRCDCAAAVDAIAWITTALSKHKQPSVSDIIKRMD